MTDASWVCVGVITGAHGIRGGVRVKCFTDSPEDLDAYGPLWDEGGKTQFIASVVGVSKGQALVSLKGVTDRNRAEGMKGVRLYVPRDVLPPVDEDEFLVGDLVGLKAVTPSGEPLGLVKGVYDFGAGEVLEIDGPGGTIMVTFTADVVPEIDLEGGVLVVDPPPFAPDEREDGERDEDKDGG